MNLWFDLRYAWRLLRKSWGYSLMCASVVALSIGLAMWSYALAYSQAWKPLPFAGSEHWYSVQMAANATAGARPFVDAYTWQEIVAHNRSADVLGAFADRVAILGEGQASTSLRAAAITPRLLAATRTAPHAGRLFDDAHAQNGAAPVAILSFEAWQAYFGGDPAIVGKTARIDAAPVRIIGVMPRDFLAFRDYELWMPLQLPHLAGPRDSTLNLSPLILRGKEQNLNAVVNEMQTTVKRVNSEHPTIFHSARHLKLIPAARIFTHGNTPIVAMIGFMAAGVLLLGCVNISMVFLARLLERSREIALRTALGASRSRVLRQCLLETALVVVIGLVGGYGFALLGVRWAHGIGEFMSRVLASGSSGNRPQLRPIDLVAAVLVAMTIWMLSTLIPAWRVARRDAAVTLAGSGKGAAVRGSNKSVGLLVGLQVVISCVVLMMCGNLVVAVDKEVRKPNGIVSARSMISTAPAVFGERYGETPQRLRYWEELTASVKSKVPGADVAFMTASPTRPARATATIETQQGTDRQGTFTLPYAVVSDNYFEMLGITLRSGRLFDSTDNPASLDVAVIDEQIAARYWPDQNALGKRIRLHTTDDAPWLTIVGVVSAVTGRPYRNEEVGVVYQPLRQVAPPQFQILVKSPADADQRAAVRAAAFAVDRDLPLQNLQTLDDYIFAVNLGFTAMIPIIIVIALITAVLAASGLFGLISRSVAQRTQEVGIRRALGATSWRSTSMFRRQGALYLSASVVGVVLGILVTAQMSRIFTNILDFIVPVTLGVVSLMALVIFSASYLPTRRAVALEPGDALRYE